MKKETPTEKPDNEITPQLRRRLAALVESYRQCQAAALELQKEAREVLESLPDNPAIERLGANCFTISSSSLASGLAWDPFSHDFKQQYLRILEHLESAIDSPCASRLALLHKILESGKESAGGRSYHYHPEVLRQASPIVSSIIAELAQILKK